ncbi:hypothetical protein C5E45_32815 [Nocardia nova]|uniref:Uncharacterized protein n=1 Tax=Nocardia nova TaxID=37330 RepID=A0A2S6ACQ5_9NOCA|nr:hypothetical protein [Nocardia nova]PPJ31874.1 hypothetical protein C5E45_32815 [Nocardia nova]
MIALGHIVVLGEWAIVLGIVVGLIEAARRPAAIVADECSTCAGTGGSNGADWCEDCNGTGRIVDEGAAWDRGHDEYTDREMGVA